MLRQCVGEHCDTGEVVTNIPPSPPQPCTQRSECTSACGVTPDEYRDSLGLVEAGPNQCYQCGRESSQPGWCTFIDGSDCCVLHECSGLCPAPPPAPPAECAKPSGCTHACGVTPAEYSAAEIPQIGLDQCYFCTTYRLSNAPEWCAFRFDGYLEYATPASSRGSPTRCLPWRPPLSTCSPKLALMHASRRLLSVTAAWSTTATATASLALRRRSRRLPTRAWHSPLQRRPRRSRARAAPLATRRAASPRTMAWACRLLGQTSATSARPTTCPSRPPARTCSAPTRRGATTWAARSTRATAAASTPPSPQRSAPSRRAATPSAAASQTPSSSRSSTCQLHSPTNASTATRGHGRTHPSGASGARTTPVRSPTRALASSSPRASPSAPPSLSSVPTSSCAPVLAPRAPRAVAGG